MPLFLPATADRTAAARPVCARGRAAASRAPADRAVRRRVRARAARGLSLLELVVFIVVVSAALAGVLRVFVQATAGSADPLLQRQALAIAESLLEEAMLLPYTYCDGDDAQVATAASPAGCAGTPEVIGPEAGEQRTQLPPLDHVNDMHGLAMNGITDITGAAVSGLGSYAASVAVQASALNGIAAGSGDALRVTVTVTAPDGSQVVLDGWRTRHAPNSSL